MQRDLPYELDDTLRTLGQTDLGGSISGPKAKVCTLPCSVL